MQYGHMYIVITGNEFNLKKFLQVPPLPDADALEQMFVSQEVLGLNKEYSQEKRNVREGQYEMLRNLIRAGGEYYSWTDDHLSNVENRIRGHSGNHKERRDELSQSFLLDVLEAIYDLGMREESLALRDAYRRFSAEPKRTSYPQTLPPFKFP